MTFTTEQMNKAKSAKTAEELLALAKASGIEMTEEQAKTYFAALNKQGELTDDELNSVAGGGKGDPEPPPAKYWVGQTLYTKDAVPIMCKISNIGEYIDESNGYSCELVMHYGDGTEVTLTVSEAELDSNYNK